MDKDIKTSLYVTYYREVYDYIKDKVKNHEQAVEITKEIFEDIFELQNEVNEPEKFLELAKTTADEKCKNLKWKKRKNGLLIIGGVFCAVGIIGSFLMISYLEDIGYLPSNYEVCQKNIGGISQSDDTYDLLNSGNVNQVYDSIGIEDISLLKDAAITYISPEEAFYVAMVQAHNEEDVGYIIDLMKKNIKPQKWYEEYYIEVGTPEDERYWNGISVEDFEFYVNGEFILITYVKPELVESGQRLSVEEIQRNFDEAISQRYMSKKNEQFAESAEESFCTQEFHHITWTLNGVDFKNDMNSLEIYHFTGIGDINLVKDGAMHSTDPYERFYVLMLQAHHEEDVKHIINLMKENMKPQEWFKDLYNDTDRVGKEFFWGDVTIEDFEFYVNGEFILVTYVDPELVESGERPSPEIMQKNFDKAIRKRNIEKLMKKFGL